MTVSLKIIAGPNENQTIRLDAACTLSLGRDPESDFVLPEANASRHHARLVWDGHRLLLEDLDSRNGVLVNGKRIEKNFSLGTGDMVKLGGCVLSVESMEGTDFSYRRTVNLDVEIGTEGVDNPLEE